MGGDGAEVERAREVLRNLIDLSGLSRREVEKRLAEQECSTDLTRLLGGKLDLRLRHVVGISRAIGIHPLEFFQMVFREPEERSPLLQRLEVLMSPARTQPASRVPRAQPVAGEIEDLRRRVAALAGEVERLKAAAHQGRPR